MREPTSSLQGASADEMLAKLRDLPVRNGREYWEVSLMEAPVPSQGKTRASGGTAVGVPVAVCVSSCEDIATSLPPPGNGQIDDGFALRAVAACALEPHAPGLKPIRYLPSRVHVGTLAPAMLQTLRTTLEALGIAVEVKASLPRVEQLREMLQLVVEGLDGGEGPGEPPPALMSSPGMTVERVRAFAEAGAAFFKAKAWRFASDDLWEVLSPRFPDELRFFTVMGGGGEVFGVGFHKSVAQYAAMVASASNSELFWKKNRDTIWCATIDELIDSPPEDVLLWHREGLPKCGKDRIPVVMGVAEKMRYIRPSPRELACMEGVLRALAQLKTREAASGELRAKVPTADGEVEMVLSRRSDHWCAAERPPRPGAVLQIRVSVDGSEPEIWRRLLVRDDALLYELHSAIQHSFGWADYHMHEFTVRKARYKGPPTGGIAVDSMWDDGGGIGTGEVTVAELALKPRSKFVYTYDFGDGWDHTVVVEKILTAEQADVTIGESTDIKANPHRPTPVAVCIDGMRAGPIEDSGGIHGYMDLCMIMADAAHPEHDERKEWVEFGAANRAGEGFDPARFDKREANARLRRVLKV